MAEWVRLGILNTGGRPGPPGNREDSYLGLTYPHLLIAVEKALGRQSIYPADFVMNAGR